MKSLKLFISEYGTTVVLGGNDARLTKSFNCSEEWEKEDLISVEKGCCGRSYDDWKLEKKGTVVKQFPDVTSLAKITETENYSSINAGHETEKYFKNEFNSWIEISQKKFNRLFRKYAN